MRVPERRQLEALVLRESLVPVARKRRTALKDGSQRSTHAIESDINDEAFTEQVEFVHRAGRDGQEKE